MKKPALVPVMLSVPTPGAIRALVAKHYKLKGPLKARFWQQSVNLTYMIDGADERWALRIYTPGWRSKAQVDFELAEILFLQRAGVPVSTPQPTRSGAFSFGLRLPDGATHAVLFSFAKRSPGERDETEVGSSIGRALAGLHAAQAQFKRPPRQRALDLKGLVDAPLRAVRPYRASFGKDWALLQKIAARIRRQLKALPRTAPAYGLIHGDTHGGNMHFDKERGHYVFFDFDLSPSGWRIFDIATSLWDLGINDMGGKKLKRAFEALVKAYNAEHPAPLSRTEIRAVPAMMAARHLWFIGFHAENAHRWGHSMVGEGSHAWKMKFLKRWYKGDLKKSFA